MNVQVLADPAGRLIWTFPALPDARHDTGAAREHGIIDALEHAGVRVITDSAHHGARANVEVPHRCPPRDPATGERRRRLLPPQRLHLHQSPERVRNRDDGIRCL